jgi:hypothetical protein
MAKKILSITLIYFVFFTFLSLNSNDDKDYNTCLERYDTNWGEACPDCTYSPDIFKAFYKNICDEPIDVLISLQKKDKKWDCFYFENVKPNEKLTTFVCKGTGKTLKWARKAGDKEIVFPTKEEVNEQYKK